MWPFGKGATLAEKGERFAARHLQRRGFVILERNVRLGRYEIDIIAQDKDTIAFVEVKTRRDTTLAAPEENVTAEKRRHIRRAAHHYIERRDDPGQYYRFDIVAVTIPEEGKPSATLFRDAFPDE